MSLGSSYFAILILPLLEFIFWSLSLWGCHRHYWPFGCQWKIACSIASTAFTYLDFCLLHDIDCLFPHYFVTLLTVFFSCPYILVILIGLSNVLDYAIYITVNFRGFLIFILFFNFTILYWFCHTSAWIRHRYTCVPHPEPSSLLPPHTIPLGRPSSSALSIQYRASNLDWRLVSYMILYMFQCHSPKSSHPLPLPQSPKDCSIYQCLFCCLVYRVIVTTFLNSIYMH